MKVRFRMWRDDEHRRFIATGDGTMIVEPKETAILIVGKDLDAKLLAALGVELEETEE